MRARRIAAALIFVLCIGLTGQARAQDGKPAPEDLKALGALLSKPEIQAWLQTQGAAPAQPAPSRRSLGSKISVELDSARQHLQEMADSAPNIPYELAGVRTRLADELNARPLVAIGIPVLVFAGLGFGLERLFWAMTPALRRRIRAKWVDTPTARIKSIALRLLYGCAEIVAFATGSVGAFLLFRWAPLLERSVLTYLIIFLGVRLTLIVLRIGLSKTDARFRLLPMSDATAQYWLRWLAAIVSLFILGKFSVDLLPDLGISTAARDLIEIAFGFSQLVLVLTALWRAPLFNAKGYVARKYVVTTWIVTLYCIVLWIMALAGTGRTFSIGIMVLALPIALRCVRLAIDHVFRPPEGETKQEMSARQARPVLAVAIDRGISAILLVLAFYTIAAIAGFTIDDLAEGGTAMMRLARAAINAAVILLISDCIWQMCKAWIDAKLHEANAGRYFYGEEARRNARTRTLLPVLRNMISVTMVLVAGLMVLAALGVEIGPLIAGAGVVGVAVGFGSQTLVKDIISGIFFLFDDAFRAGEYIESGTISGTVEAFSVRSVKLRHALGALHTIPLGSLSTITNYSRDWVIDELFLNVPFDTDLDKVRTVVEEIGKELAADKSFGPSIIDPLKFIGVDRFGDFAIRISLRQMTRPGEQHAIRRRAYELLQRAFAENGIVFALPSSGAASPAPRNAGNGAGAKPAV